MIIEVGEHYQFYGKIEQINTSTYDSYACNVLTQEGDSVIVRISENQEVLLNKIYYFETEAMLFKEKTHLLASKAIILNNLKLDDNTKEQLMRAFYQYAPVKLSDIREGIESRIAMLENPVLKAITDKIYAQFENDFYLYPAATKFHHAYISGLSYHTYTMLKLSDGFLTVYPFLNRDLIYSGIILHDVCKILEFDTYEGSEYTLKGRLIGHITMAVNLIHSTAKELNIENEEEVMLLEHIILSHHYYGNFGSPKKPNIAEALIVHFIDNIDSKVNELGEALELVKIGDSTPAIGVLERERYYKHKLSKE